MMTKRKKITGILILAAALVLAAFGLVSQAMTQTEDREVQMEVSLVYGNQGRMGVHIPVTVKLYVQSAGPFEGMVCFDSMETTENQDTEVYEYQYPVSVNAGATESFRFYVPLGQKSSQMRVSLVDEDGKKQAEELLEFQVPKDTGSLFIGVLDDDPDSILYLDGVNLNYGMVRSSLIFLDAGTVPEDVRGLDLLDILVINNFSTDSLSGQQQDAIRKWVREGGILLLGTGGRVEDTLGSFAEDLAEQPYEQPRMQTLNMGAEYGEGSPGGSVVRTVCADLSIPGGDELMSSDELPLLTSVRRGKGTVGIFSFDLGELADFAGENPSFAENIFTSVLGEETIRNLYYYGAYGDDSGYWNAQSLVNTGNAERLPNLALYGVVIVIYILTIGPGLYLFLKKKDIQRFYGTGLMLLACLASAVVYLLGEKTRFRSEFFTYAMVCDVEEDEIEETAYLNIRTPDDRPYSVTVTPGYQVTPVTRTALYDNRKDEVFTGEEESSLTIAYTEEGTRISSGGSQAFSPRFFVLTKKTGNENHQGISSDLSYFDGELTGTVTNHFPFPLEKAALIFYGQAVVIGHMEPGETKTLDGSRILTYPPDMTFLLAGRLSGDDSFEQADISNQEYLTAQEQTSLYSFFLSSYFGNYTSGARIAGFGPEDRAAGLFTDEGGPRDGLTIYTSSVDVDMEQNGCIYRSGVMKTPKVTSGSGSYYSSYTTIYGNEQTVVEYYLGSDIRIEKVSFLPVSEEFLENPRYYYLHKFEGKAYFYNYSTKSYDPADLTVQDFSAEELRDYLSPSNSLTVKYVNENGETGSSTFLPTLMVTGRER